MIKHDAQGFLVGEMLDLSRQLLGGQREGLDALSRIERAISKMAGTSRGRRIASADAVAVQPTVRRSGGAVAPVTVGRLAGQAAAEAALRTVRGQRTDSGLIVEPRIQRTGATLGAGLAAVRDERGRFVSKRGPGLAPVPGGGGSGAGGGGEDFGGGRGREFISQLANNLRDATSNATQNIDPAIQAANEVRNVVEPLGRGLSMVAGRRKEQKQERWWRRIHRALTDRRRDEPATIAFSGQAKGDGILDGATGGVVVSIIGKILPMLGRILLPILGVAGAALAGLGIGSLISGWMDRAGVTQKVLDAVDGMKQGWANLVKKAGDVWGQSKELGARAAAAVQSAPGRAANAANNAIRNATGVDVKSGVATVAGGFERGGEVARQVAGMALNMLPPGLRRGAGLMKAAVGSGILDPRKLANFMGQMYHESAGFTRMEESLSYSPERLMSVFKKRFRSLSDARAVAAKGPEAIAERVYGGRMGNTQAGDGYKYRGRGYVQLTGKDNYAAASKELGIDLVNNPDMAADPAVAAKVAAWYWKRRVSQRGLDGTVEGATYGINGGYNGLSDRRDKVAMFERAFADPAFAAQFNTASVPTAKTPQAAPPKVAAVSPPGSVELSTRLNRDQDRTITVKLPRDVGQNVGDRGIAHVVTGGLGG